MKYFIQISLIILFLTQCDSDTPKENSIAMLNDREISLGEFRSFYNFDVNFGIDSTGVDALKDELLFYCDQIRALDRAEKDGLADDSIFVRSYIWEKERAMLRELYRQYVLKNVTVSDRELRKLYQKQQAKVNLQHLFFKTEAEATEVFEQLNNAKTTFEIKAAQIFKDDSLANSAGRIGWIKISDLDDQLATALLDLPVNTVSMPVKSKWGYHLLLYRDIKKNPIITESEFVNNIPSLQKKIRAQKAAKLSSQFINSHIGSINPQLDPAAFEKLWKALLPEYYRESDYLDKKIEITPTRLSALTARLKDSMADRFIGYKDSHISMEAFITDISKRPVSQRFVFKTKRELSNQIGKWVRDKFLLKKAYSAGIDKHERVIYETRRYMEEQSYYYYHAMVTDTITTPLAVRKYFSSSSTSDGTLPKSMKGYHTLQEWKFEYAKRQLRKYFKPSDHMIQINDKLLQEENDTINWDNKIRMFMVRKPQ